MKNVKLVRCKQAFKDLLILLKIFFALCKRSVAALWMPLLQVVERLVRYQLAHYARRRGYLYQMVAF